MTTITEIVAAVVVHSSAAAFSHFGVTLEQAAPERPAPVVRTIVRTPQKATPTRAADCPGAPRPGRRDTGGALA